MVKQLIHLLYMVLGCLIFEEMGKKKRESIQMDQRFSKSVPRTDVAI